jgi:hypothetical protein
MHISTLLTATLAATTTALNATFLCPYTKQGACCQHFNPTTGFGELCEFSHSEPHPFTLVTG